MVLLFKPKLSSYVGWFSGTGSWCHAGGELIRAKGQEMYDKKSGPRRRRAMCICVFVIGQMWDPNASGSMELIFLLNKVTLFTDT